MSGRHKPADYWRYPNLPNIHTFPPALPSLLRREALVSLQLAFTPMVVLAVRELPNEVTI
jgi:hypothetical protein